MRNLPIQDLSRDSGLIDTIVSAMASVAAGGRYILGPQCEAFEREFAEYCGVGFAIGVANGTDALELALKALGVQTGERVMTVANAGMYSTTAILATGAEPVFIDIDPATLLLSEESLAADLHDSIAALVITHLYGKMPNMDRIQGVALPRGTPIVEDCAQAHGASFLGRKAGSWGTLACFSFYPTKNLGALGDGGAVVTDDPELAVRVRQLRQYGWAEKYRSSLLGGRNSRLDELQAAVLRVKLAHLDRWNERRREIASVYGTRLDHDKVRKPLPPDPGNACHLYVIRCEDQAGLRAHLARLGIGSDVHYPVPDYAQPSLRGRFPGISLPETDRACSTVVSLPCFPQMTDGEVMDVVEAVNSWKG